jgi:mycobactin phenyloxazoline synthetase
VKKICSKITGGASVGDVVLSREEIRLLLAEQLELDAGAIGFDDDLFVLGLQSMRMIKLAAGWRRRGVDVNFGDLAERPSVQAWYELLAERTRGGVSTQTRSAQRERAEPVANDEPFGLATMQHGYWIGRADGQVLGGVAAHLYAEFDGTSVDPSRLERAVANLVRRHGMLRSQFLEDGTQRVLDQPGLPVWSVTDLRDARAEEVHDRLAEIRESKTHQRMRADLGKVLDVSLTLLPDGRSRLHVDVDMLAADALSYRVMMADLADFYTQDDDGLPPLTYDYRQYLADHAAVTASVRERERAWWQELLPELPDPPALPLVPESERADPLRTVRYKHWLDAEDKGKLIDRAHKHGVTPAVVLASVFAQVVGKWSGEQRFLLNLPLFDREPLHPDVESLVGDFSSSVLLDVDIDAQDTALGLAKRFQRKLHSRAAHAGYPGLDVLRDLGRWRSEPVLASVVYTSGLNLGELFRDTVISTFGEPVWIISQGPQVVLDTQIVELRGGILLNWDVREQAFPPGLMDAMFARYHEIITDLLRDDADWDQPRPQLLPPEQASIRRQVNDTARPVSGRLLHEGFFAHADTTPDAPALLWHGGEFSYRELRDRALRVAGALVTRGVLPGDAVSIQLPKGPDQIVAAIGVLAAGGCYVPIGFDQPAIRRDRIQQIGNVVIAVVDEHSRHDSDQLGTLSIAEAMQFSAPLADMATMDTESIAYVMFTSGSTGQPKGVEVTHAAAMNTLDCVNEHFGSKPGDRSLALSALEFDLSVYDMFGLLSAGGGVVVVDDESRKDGHRAVELIRALGVTHLNCVPSLLDMVLAAAEPDGLGDTLRVVILGGDWVGADLPERLHKLSPNCRFAGLGGTTETAIHSTVCEVTGTSPAGWHAVPYGTPMGNVRCRVVDGQGSDCPDWVAGELWIGGLSVARGYRNDPERTADRFVQHEGERWYRTGDLARYWPDGTLEFLGRRDHQVKVRGHRVELGEVEAALRAAPGVRRAVAAVIGQGSQKLVAAVTVTGDRTGDQIRAEAGESLPPYMVPELVEVLDEFPLTSNGKLDRRAVRSLLAEGAEGPQNDYAAPANDLEAALADVVGQVLAVRDVGVESDFFALGGDSVLATTVIANIRAWLDTSNAAVADLFATRTVRSLALRLADKQHTPGRLEQAARIYLEVTAMSDDEVLAESANGQ